MTSKNKFNPKTSYLYHFKKAGEPIFLVTLVSSLALNLAILNSNRDSENKLHENRIRSLEALKKESEQTLMARKTTPGNLLDLPFHQFIKTESFLAEKLQYLGIDAEKVGFHPVILRESKSKARQSRDIDNDGKNNNQDDDDDDYNHNWGPKQVSWSEALFGNSGKAKIGMRKTVAGIKESFTSGFQRNQQTLQSEKEAVEREIERIPASRSGSQAEEASRNAIDRTQWSDKDWEDGE